jgi:hypothetical protein
MGGRGCVLATVLKHMLTGTGTSSIEDGDTAQLA